MSRLRRLRLGTTPQFTQDRAAAPMPWADVGGFSLGQIRAVARSPRARQGRAHISPAVLRPWRPPADDLASFPTTPRIPSVEQSTRQRRSANVARDCAGVVDPRIRSQTLLRHFVDAFAASLASYGVFSDDGCHLLISRRRPIESG